MGKTQKKWVLYFVKEEIKKQADHVGATKEKENGEKDKTNIEKKGWRGGEE